MITPPLEKAVLYRHVRQGHMPRNTNIMHAVEVEVAGLNATLALALTRRVGTMWTAYIFAVLAVIGLLAILGVLTPIIALLVAWTSQTLIQLVLLPIIMVGQNVLGRKSELQADEAYLTTMKSFTDIESIMAHLEAQDVELLKQSTTLSLLLRQKADYS